MAAYALLLLPSANRVYGSAARALSLAELDVLASAVLPGRLDDLELTDIEGVPYLGFRSPTDLDEREIAYLSNLSAAQALFRRSGDSLHPLRLRPLDRYDDDLLTILKYSGKTNEQFTKLLLNVTVLHSAAAPVMLDRQLRVLDPVCGRGTTLSQSLVYGWHAAGIDEDTKAVEAYGQFLETWLQRKRLKHTFEAGRVRRENRVVGRRFRAETAPTKELWHSGHRSEVTVLSSDSTTAGEHFRAESFDAVVGDLPYGVQHRSRTAQSARRGPLELLDAALPAWTSLLKPGGTIGLAWNTLVGRPDAVRDTLARHGLEPCPTTGFTHRVDASITRDIAVARKP